MTPTATEQKNPAEKAAGTAAVELRWVAAWLAYSLLALGFFAWQDAWLGFMCITR